MKIAPHTYYRWLACGVTPAEWDQAHLVNTIADLYRRNRCVYGARKMWHAARRAGLGVGRDQVGRLMHAAGARKKGGCTAEWIEELAVDGEALGRSAAD